MRRWVKAGNRGNEVRIQRETVGEAKARLEFLFPCNVNRLFRKSCTRPSLVV